jgi:hypothetical protein
MAVDVIEWWTRLKDFEGMNPSLWPKFPTTEERDIEYLFFCPSM